MSYADDEVGMTAEEAQEAMEEGDMVTEDELREMHPDKSDRQLGQFLAEQNEEPPHVEEEPRAAARQGRKTYHTGPKGVLTDFEEAKLKMRARRLQEKLGGEERLRVTGAAEDDSHKLTAFQIRSIAEKQSQTEKAKEDMYTDKNEEKHAEEDTSDEDLESDDEAMIAYKMHKMKVAQMTKARYGNMMEVTAWTFEKEVDNAPKDTIVVVNVFQDYLERCARMNQCLAQVAIAHPHIKFLRARSDRIGLDSYPEVGLPTLIVFQNGKQAHNFIAVHQLIGGDISPKAIEDFLIQQKVLLPTLYVPDKPTVKSVEEAEQRQREAEEEELDATHGSGKKKKKNKVQISGTSKLRFSSRHDDDSDSELDID